jgi:DNA-binding winged helix-turn-helix (wHTH) protein
LLVLVENSGHIVEKDELMERVWPDVIVEESTLAQNISTLRKALGERSSEQRYIETVPKHGYRFLANVQEVGDNNADLTTEERTRLYVLIDQEHETSTPDVKASPESASLEEPFAPSGKGKRVLKWRVGLAVLAVCAAAAVTLVLKTAKIQPPHRPS